MKDFLLYTETDGLPRHTVINEEFIKHFPQLLKVVIMEAETGEKYLDTLVKPFDATYEVPKHITKLNGIETKDLSEGMEPQEVLHRIITLEGRIVCHNLDFQSKVINSFAFRCLGEDNINLFGANDNSRCLMKAAKDECRIEGSCLGDYKYPSMKEMIKILELGDEKMRKETFLLSAYSRLKDCLDYDRFRPACF